MGNIFRFLLVLPCITLLLYSCESEIENEIQSSTEKLNLSGLESDSLQLESYELSEMTDELKALKERIDELKKAKTRSVASSNYSQYFSENMWAIRELPFTLSTGGGYLSCTGWGQRVTYEGYNPGSYGKFYVQIPSSITGIPYLIYSNYSKTRLAVGHYTSNPESKILLAMSSNSTTGAMDSWDIIPATNNPGTYVLQNELYLGQGSSGSWWDVFNYVVDIQANNVGFSQYTQRAQQEFTITPDAVFTLKSLEFINPYSATVTQRENVSIKRAITNSSSQFVRENLVFEKAIQEDSYFKEEKGIAFKVPASDMLFARPTVTLGEIDLFLMQVYQLIQNTSPMYAE